MKFTLKGPFGENVYNLMRKIGYHFLKKDEKSGELNFVRPLKRDGYPRFHLYLKIENGNLIFDLHLDQKRPIYKGTTAHSGEYSGEIVGKEAKRIKQIFKI